MPFPSNVLPRPAMADEPRPLPRIAFALNPAEREKFFPDSSPGLPGIECRWIDLSETGWERRWKQEMRRFAPEILVSAWQTPAVPLDWVAGPDAFLRYVCHLCGSVRHLIERRHLEEGLLVSNWGTLASPMVAEHAVLLVLASLRNLPLWAPFMQTSRAEQDRNRPALRTATLRGRRVGLHGFGAIAREIARLLAPFGASIQAYSEGVPPEFVRQHGVRPCASLDELFSTSNVLIECEALTERSAGSVDDRILRRLPEDATFVNVGRGTVVDEEALARAGIEGRLRIACDVYREEPLPQDAPLREVGTAILSPHIAGPTDDAFPRCGAFALQNIALFLQGRTPQSLLTPEIYDRST